MPQPDPQPLDDLHLAIAQLDTDELTYSRDWFGAMAAAPKLNAQRPRLANVIGAFAGLFATEAARRAGTAEGTTLVDILDDEP